MKGRITLRSVKPGDSDHLNELKSRLELITEESKNAGELIDLRISTLSELVLDLSQRISIIEESLKESILSALWRELKQRIRCLFTNTPVNVDESTKDTEK